ncbi:hypothetical protein G7Y89_g1952 [Cudoniella acicularis]|uniref:gamma-glutamylcyclotransferase n=1 Tax=Cudoniella acicularis TaxID=354080 RepID=A0A8H4RW26_9HELO|nr:hypothetical protein G7Y89_g1952 [Cudoniella acicularis]
MKESSAAHVNFTAKSDTLWYLAYGSNMSLAKFTGSRGITPLSSARVRIPGWILARNIPGLPYSEPTFMSITERSSTTEEIFPISSPDVFGVAYLITSNQYRQVIASEGGGIGYDDIAINVVPVAEEDEKKIGPRLRVRTLRAAVVRNPWPSPSKRYMNIVMTGAREAGLPLSYQLYLEDIATYEPPTSSWCKFGAAIFLAIWGPVMALMEKLTNATILDNGCAPMFVIWLVRAVMHFMWLTHDVLFAPLCGRGDGRKCENKGYADIEKSPSKNNSWR